MEKELIETVRNLNRINLLYKYAIRHGKPYRVAFVRKIWEKMSGEVMKSITKFDSNNYTEVFPLNPQLEIVMMKKQEAINRAEYLIASSFRDREIEIIRSLLASIGVAKSDQFFLFDNRIYKFL